MTLPEKPEHERDGAIDPEVSSSGRYRKHLRPSGKFDIRGHKQAPPFIPVKAKRKENEFSWSQGDVPQFIDTDEIEMAPYL